MRDGQRVARRALIVLGDGSVAADMNRLGFRVLAEQASVARLEAEQALRDAVLFPPSCARPRATCAWPSTWPRSARCSRHAAMRCSGQSTCCARSASKVQRRLRRCARRSCRPRLAQPPGRRAGEQQQPAARRFHLHHAHQPARSVGGRLRGQARRAALGLARAEQRIVDTDLRIKSLESEYRQQASDQFKVAPGLRDTAGAAQDRRRGAADHRGAGRGRSHGAEGHVAWRCDSAARDDCRHRAVGAEAARRGACAARRHQACAQRQVAEIRFTAFNHRTTPSWRARFCTCRATASSIGNHAVLPGQHRGRCARCSAPGN